MTGRFNDGAAYERMMGTWSRFAGEIFLDWLAPRLRTCDGSTSAAATAHSPNCLSTGARLRRCRASIPPRRSSHSPARGRQRAWRSSSTATRWRFPSPTSSFDAAIMALVIFFVPDPAKGVAEMVRVVRPGGIVATYAWDMFGGGFPLDPLQIEMRAMGIIRPRLPSADASRMEALRELWADRGPRSD